MRLSLFILLAAGLASAASVEIRTRQECFALPTAKVTECLSVIRSGRSFETTVEGPTQAPATEAQEETNKRSQPKSLEERSVEAQESAVRAQQGIASAIWASLIVSLAGSIILIATSK